MLKLLVIGNLGADAVVNRLEGGKTVINMNVAHSEKWKDRNGTPMQSTTWVQAAYWTDKINVAQYLKKGTQVYLEGFPEMKTFQKRDGTIGSALTLRVVSVQLLGSAKADNAAAPAAATGASQPIDIHNIDPNSLTEPIDDLPF